MPRTKQPSVYIAITTGVANIDGEDVPFYRDRTRVSAGHPLLKRVPGAFKPAEELSHYRATTPTGVPEEMREDPALD